MLYRDHQGEDLIQVNLMLSICFCIPTAAGSTPVPQE